MLSTDATGAIFFVVIVLAISGHQLLRGRNRVLPFDEIWHQS